MRLSDVRKRICVARAAAGESEPAVTTVSTYLRSAFHKGLVEEVRVNEAGEVEANGQRGRGALRTVRSPKTAYRAAVQPRDVFADTLHAIAQCYPKNQKLDLLVDVAITLEVPKSVVSQIQKWVQRRRK